MLIAVDRTRIKVYAKDCQDRKQSLYCGGCGESVILKKGPQKVAHFAHRANHQCRVFSEGETQEHLTAKELLAGWHSEGLFELEAYLPELQQRPDLLRGKIAIEVQCSPLSFARFLERTENYLAHGYQPWWILGRRLYPKRHWSSFQKACCELDDQGNLRLWTIDTEEQRLTLVYGIIWHYRFGYFFKMQHWGRGCDLAKLRIQQPEKSTPVKAAQWQPEGYRFWVLNKMVQGNEELRQIQEMLYLEGISLGNLPHWCYAPSRYHFFFEDRLLVLRSFYAVQDTPDFKTWLQQLKNLAWRWPYPFIDQKMILWQVYCECQKLTKQAF